jgi:gas vesicle protein
MNKNRTLLVGALAGAVTGLVAAMLLNRRAEQEGTQLALSAGDGMKLGVMVIGLLRAIASLGEEK